MINVRKWVGESGVGAVWRISFGGALGVGGVQQEVIATQHEWPQNLITIDND